MLGCLQLEACTGLWFMYFMLLYILIMKRVKNDSKTVISIITIESIWWYKQKIDKCRHHKINWHTVKNCLLFSPKWSINVFLRKKRCLPWPKYVFSVICREGETKETMPQGSG